MGFFHSLHLPSLLVWYSASITASLFNLELDLVGKKCIKVNYDTQTSHNRGSRQVYRETVAHRFSSNYTGLGIIKKKTLKDALK